MIYLQLIEYLDTIVKQQSSAVLLAKSEKASELAMDVLGRTGDIYQSVREMAAVYTDETSYTVARVADRLRKASAKSTQAVVRDQIRLAIRQLETLREPDTADTEPIDIFDDVELSIISNLIKS